MTEEQEPKIFDELSKESQSETEDDQEGPAVDPGNSPPEAWTEDLTADEIDAVVKQLEDHVVVEKLWDESTPKEENL